MNKKTQPFHYRIIKARIAETIIKELFKHNAYRVYNFGMEEVLPGIVGSLNTNKSVEASQIRQLPDFVVQNSSDGQLFYVEVKYRHNGIFQRTALDKDFKYANAIFIIVHKSGIGCISFKELDEIGYLPNEDPFTLKGQKYFMLKKESIEEFEAYAQRFFKGVD
jgi:hypothetical protein